MIFVYLVYQNKLEIELLAVRRELEMERALAAKDKTNLNQTLERDELRLKDLETHLSTKNQVIEMTELVTLISIKTEGKSKLVVR